MLKRHLILLLLFLTTAPALAAGLSDTCENEILQNDRNRKLWLTNLTGIGVITVWGIVNWDYFATSPHSESEGWFSNDTKEGGSDKIGHLYTSYVTAHGLSSLYEHWCFSKDDAALFGALSSFSIMGYMELGDSFSSYGFSHEDMLVNMAGCAFGYLTYKYPELKNKIDFRWEYGFHPNDSDFITDYDNSKHLIAIKLSGFDTTRESIMKHIELHLGYYTRGFSDKNNDKERNIYIGIGFNLTDTFRRFGCHKTARILNYIQIPNTYIQIKNDLNE